MRKPALILASAMVALQAGAAEAVVFRDFARFVSLEFRDANGTIIDSDSDSESLPAGGVFTQPLNAFIGGSGYQASIGMDVSGFFGIAGFLGGIVQPGTLTASVDIIIEVENDLAVPINVPFDFIINGGQFQIDAGVGSSLAYELAVNALAFRSVGQLAVTSGGVIFNETGDSIGAVFDSSNNRVDVPFSVQGINSTIDPGLSQLFRYILNITATAEQFAEGIFFEFRDPLQLGNLPPGATQFGPAAASTAVDEPAPLLILMAALLGLAWRRQR